MHWSLRTKILLGFGISWLAIVSAGTIGYYAMVNLTTYTSQARYAQTFHNTIDDLLAYLFRAEMGQRGFLMTGDEAFLPTYDEALPLIAENLAALHTLVDTYQLAIPPDSLEHLDQAIAEQLEILKQGIELRQAQGAMIPDLKGQIQSENAGMENIRTLLEDIKKQESAAFFRQEAQAQINARWVWILIILGSIVALGLAVIGGISISTRINTSTQALITGVRHVATGDLEYRVPISSHDEIATLTSAFNDMAERLQITQNDLAKSMALFQSLFEASPDAILVVNAQEQIVHANPQAEKLFGYAQHELEKLSLANLLPENYQETQNHPFHAFHTDLQPILFGTNPDLTILTREGKEIPVDIQLGLVTREGAPLILCVVRDISTQKRNREMLKKANEELEARVQLRTAELERSEKAYRQMAENALIGVYQSTVEGKILYANPAIAKIFGFSSVEALMQTPTQLRYKDPKAREQLLAKLLETKQVQDIELSMLTAEGTELTILVNMTLDGNVLSGMLLDITARKTTEAQLQIYARRFAILAEASQIFSEASLNYQDVLSKIAQFTAETFGDFCLLHQFSEENIWNAQIVFYDTDPEIRAAFQTMQTNRALTEALSVWSTQARELGAPILITEEELLSDNAPLPYGLLQKHIEFTGVIILPMKYRLKVMGLLYLLRHQTTKPTFTNEDFTLAQELTDRAALAISNAHLFELVQKELVEKALAEEEIRKLNIHLEQRIAARTQELETSLAKTEALYRIARATVAIDNLEMALEQIVSGVAFGLQAHRVVLLTFDFAEKKVRHLVRGGPGAAEHTPNLTYQDWMEGLTGWVIREGKGALSLKGEPDMREGIAAQQRRLRTHAGCVAVVPLRFADQILGTLTAIQHSEEDNYTEADVTLLQAMANQVAAMLVHANLLENLRLSNLELQNEIAERTQLEIQIRHGETRAQALADISKTLAEARLEGQPHYHLIVRQVAELLGDACNMSLISNDGKYLQSLAFYHPDPESASLWATLNASAPYPLGTGLAGRVAQTGEPLLLLNIPPEQLYRQMNMAFAPFVEMFGLASLCIVPMHARDRIVGVVGISRGKPGTPYTHEDQLFLQDLADRAGLAIENSRLLVETNAAREEADQANQAKSEFLSRMSHELRTPLNAILGFAQILGMDALTKSQTTAVQHILQAGKHLLNLINEVLDITRIETGHLLLSPESVSLAKLLQETVEMVQPQTTSQRIYLDVHCDRALYARADRQRLKQVLLNILINAIKYNRPEGQVQITCTPLSNTALQIRIQDTGQGISLEQQKRLFVPFERLGAERTSVEGTGLGLALSQQLVRAMNGEIGVESETGVGSTFWIILPQVENPIEQSYHPHDGLIQIPPIRSHPPIYTVLYIEDNLSNLQLVEEILKMRPSIHLTAALNGKKGLEVATQKNPHLILLDLHLPDMLGDEIAHALKANPQTQHIPIIIISADATPHHIQSLLKAGVQTYLTKPLDIENFLQVLDNTLKR